MVAVFANQEMHAEELATPDGNHVHDVVCHKFEC